MKNIYTLIFILILLITTNLIAGDRYNIPGLCYHQVETVPSGKFSLSARKFTDQLKYMKEHGYESINSEQLLDIVNSGKAFPSKKVIITFDDGYKSVYTQAFPIMKKFGFIGIACIYPQFIGAGKAMTWSQLKDLIANGWSIECHSYSHSNLSKYYKNPLKEKLFLKKEMIESRNILIKKLGIDAKFMIWPYGVYTDTTLALAKETGYTGAMTVDGGANFFGIDSFFIKRQVIYSTDHLKKFLMRFEMQGLKIVDQSPSPGQVLKELTSFSFKIPDLLEYSPTTHKLNVKISRSNCKYKFDPITRIVSGTTSSIKRTGSYFIDVYLRNLQTGVTSQNGWLFTVKR